jgi:hypothetical protein
MEAPELSTGVLATTGQSILAIMTLGVSSTVAGIRDKIARNFLSIPNT